MFCWNGPATVLDRRAPLVQLFLQLQCMAADGQIHPASIWYSEEGHARGKILMNLEQDRAGS